MLRGTPGRSESEQGAAQDRFRAPPPDTLRALAGPREKAFCRSAGVGAPEALGQGPPGLWLCGLSACFPRDWEQKKKEAQIGKSCPALGGGGLDADVQSPH